MVIKQTFGYGKLPCQLAKEVYQSIICQVQQHCQGADDTFFAFANEKNWLSHMGFDGGQYFLKQRLSTQCLLLAGWYNYGFKSTCGTAYA